MFQSGIISLLLAVLVIVDCAVVVVVDAVFEVHQIYFQSLSFLFLRIPSFELTAKFFIT